MHCSLTKEEEYRLVQEHRLHITTLITDLKITQTKMFKYWFGVKTASFAVNCEAKENFPADTDLLKKIIISEKKEKNISESYKYTEK